MKANIDEISIGDLAVNTARLSFWTNTLNMMILLLTAIASKWIWQMGYWSLFIALMVVTLLEMALYTKVRNHIENKLWRMMDNGSRRNKTNKKKVQNE